MQSPKSHLIPSSQTSVKKNVSSHIHTASLSEFDPKTIGDSPKFSALSKLTQKFGSPTQKLDLTKSLRGSQERSRREKSESISTMSLFTRTSIFSANGNTANRNGSLKNRNDPLNEKTSTLNTSKTEKTSQPAARPNTKGQQIVEKKRLVLDPKKPAEKDSFEGTQRVPKTSVFMSPNTKAKDLTKVDSSKKKPLTRESTKIVEAASPRNGSTMKSSPVRSSRNPVRKEVGKEINLTGLTQTKTLGFHKKSLSMQETACSSAISRGGQEFPMDAKSALEYYGAQMSPLEREEILLFPEVYYLGDKHHKIPAKEETEYDDEKGDYQVIKSDHIFYRYEIIEMLGRGSFGQVIKAFDHKDKEFVALKIIRSQKKFHFQAKIEVKLLVFMMERHGCDHNITGLKKNFVFRNHVCLAFELMSLNLYDFLKKNKFKGFSLNVIRKFAIQALYALQFLNQHKIIHCDLKPENILLKHPNKTGIKLIDFGSSCFESEKLYTYIQSRFYRAPEIILGLNYTTQIDMWSFGCLLYELYTGQPIFPGESEQDQLLCMMEVLGAPESDLILRSPKKKQFFDEDLKPKVIPNSKGKLRLPNTVSLDNLLRCDDKPFVDLVKSCLVYDPKKRFSPNKALAHDWILGGLPPNLQAQHMKLIESSNEVRSSMKIKEEILSPEQNKVPVREASLEREMKPVHSRVPQQPDQANKSSKMESNIAKKLAEEAIIKKKLNLDLNPISEDEQVVNVTINLSDTKRNRVSSHMTKKNHQKSESISTMGFHKNPDLKTSLVNNYFYINAHSRRSTSRNAPISQDSEREINAKKGGVHLSERTLDLEYVGEAFETSENIFVSNDTLANTSAANLIFKPAANKENYSTSIGNVGVESTRATQSLSQNHIQGHHHSSRNNQNSISHQHPAIVSSPKAMAHQNVSGTFVADPSISGTNSSFQANIQLKLNTTLDVGSPANKYATLQPGTNTSLNSYQLSNTTCNLANYHSGSNTTTNNAGSQTTTAQQSQQSGNPVGIYRYINPTTTQHRNQKSMYRSDSLYAQSQSAADHYYAVGSTSTREKNNNTNHNTFKPFSLTNTSNTNTSGNRSGLGLKSPQSNRVPEKNAKKPALLDKKLAHPNQTVFSPKASELGAGKIVENGKQEGVSTSPRHMVFSMLKYPIAKKR